MAVAIKNTIEIDKIRDYVIGLSQGKAQFQIECFVWCMNETKHDSGSVLKVEEGKSLEYYRVVWGKDSVNLEEINLSIDQDEAAEYGAEGIALMVGMLKTGSTHIKKARKRGGGFDYWVGKSQGSFFQEFARLEISGIYEEKPGNTVGSRVKTKLKQVSGSDGVIPAFIVVVEFAKFIAKMVWKDE